MKKEGCKRRRVVLQICLPTPSSYGWGSPDCMWSYLTKTLLCIFGLQPRSPGGEVAQSVCVCLCPHSEMNAGPVLSACGWIKCCCSESIHVAAGERGGAERSEGKTDGPSTLNKLPPRWTPAFLMPGTERGACAADLEGCVYSGKYESQVPSLKAWIVTESQWRHLAAVADGRWEGNCLTLSAVSCPLLSCSPVHCMLLIDMPDLIWMCLRKGDIPQLQAPSVV